MKIGIIGSKTITNYESIKKILDRILMKEDDILSEEASTFNSLVEMYTRLNNLRKTELKSSKLIEESDYIVAFIYKSNDEILNTIKKAEGCKKTVIKIIVND